MFGRLMVVLWMIVAIWFGFCFVGWLYSGRVPWDGIVVGGLGAGAIGILNLLRWIIFGASKT